MDHFGPPYCCPPRYATLAAASQHSSRPTRQAPVAKPKQRRHKHTEEEWDAIRDIISRLYIEEEKKVEEVHKILNAEYNFPVGLRKLKKWLADNGISKNVPKTDMLVLYTKRLARMKVDGKKTVIQKDGRILDDCRLERFGTRYFLDSDYATYFAAATPEGYTYATPQPATFDEDLEACFDPLLFEFFTTPGQVQTVFADVSDNETFHEQIDHIHQIGVFGLRLLMHPPIAKLPFVLRDCLFLARDLMSSIMSPSSGLPVDAITAQTPRMERVPKAHVEFTGKTFCDLMESATSSVITYLKTSNTIMQLLQLSPDDQRKWRDQWCTMNSKEQTLTKSLCDKFFGTISSYSSVMSFVHISVLLASPQDPIDTVLIRLSLGIDEREFPECNACHRRVVALDCINKTGAVQLNVPLRVAWNGAWEPTHIFTNEISEHSKWSDYVYSLRGWYIHISSFLRLIGPVCEVVDDDEDNRVVIEEDNVWEERWDPMDVFTPLTAFQPNGVAVPASLCAYSDFELTQPGSMYEETDSPRFAPDTGDDETWDPSGI